MILHTDLLVLTHTSPTELDLFLHTGRPELRQRI